MSNFSYDGLPYCLKIFIYSLLFSLIITGPLWAVKVDSLFLSDEIIRIEIRSDFSAILSGRSEDPVYYDGELIYQGKKEKPTRLSVRVRARGNFRRNPSNCDFPPLYVNFRKSQVKNTIFRDQDRLKLVTPCMNEEDLIKEYLIYKMYNQVTDLSMQVRLVKVIFFDTGAGNRMFTRYSFFIEDENNLIERTHTSRLDTSITPFDLNKEKFLKMAVFQHLIGNQDWFIVTSHNIVLVKPEDIPVLPVAIPYDFDFAAFVNTEYSSQKGSADKIPENRRKYKGICTTLEELEDIFDFYRELRPAFESIITNMKPLTKSTREEILRFVGDFYTIIDSEELIRKQFMDVCYTRADYNLNEE